MNDPIQKADNGVGRGVPNTLVVQIHKNISAEIQSGKNEHFIKVDMSANFYENT